MQDPGSMGVTWLLYCCCEGIGIAQPGSPLCRTAQKCVCLTTMGECDVTSDLCGGGGLLYDMSKWLCCVHSCQLPPQQIFIEVCGVRLWGTGGVNLGGHRFGPGGKPVELLDARAEVESVRKEIDEACAAEDYGKALELKKKLDRFRKLISAQEAAEEAAHGGEAAEGRIEGVLSAEVCINNTVFVPPSASAHME